MPGPVLNASQEQSHAAFISILSGENSFTEGELESYPIQCKWLAYNHTANKRVMTWNPDPAKQTDSNFEVREDSQGGL